MTLSLWHAAHFCGTLAEDCRVAMRSCSSSAPALAAAKAIKQRQENSMFRDAYS